MLPPITSLIGRRGFRFPVRPETTSPQIRGPPLLLALLEESQENAALLARLESSLGHCRRVTRLSTETLQEIVAGNFSFLVVDCKALSNISEITFQALMGISNVLPSLYFNAHLGPVDFRTRIRSDRAQTLIDQDPSSILAEISFIQERAKQRLQPVTGMSILPRYDSTLPTQILHREKAISMLAIDASAFSAIEARFGKTAYHRSVDFLHSMLMNLWGAAGSFRSKDFLCRHNEMSHLYLVFLQGNRNLAKLPPPGSLERLADRIQVQIENALWQALSRKKRPDPGLPSGLSIIPEVFVGYASATSSILDDHEKTVEKMIAEALRSTSLQQKRSSLRRRELMHNLVATKEALLPAFQGVFRLPGLSKDVVEESLSSGKLAPLKQFLFGFESLIRAQDNVIRDLLGASLPTTLDPSLLTPDVLFSLAKSSGTSLELDHRAMQQALAYGNNLPGHLMINILPRNFYNLPELRKSVPKSTQIIFEISESEAIENFDLVQELRADLKSMNIGVATDDFGRDFGGLERIFKLQPDIIKLDRALVENIHLDPSRLAFVAGLVQSVRIIHAKILAEGVELWEEAEALQALGVEFIQGYLLHRPETIEKLTATLEGFDSENETTEETNAAPSNIYRIRSA